MKKLLILMLIGFTVVSCTEDITDYNVDPKRPETVPAGTLFTNAEKNLGDLMTKVYHRSTHCYLLNLKR